MRHAERKRRVGASSAFIQWSANFVWPGVVRRDDDDLLPAVARLGHEVRVRRTGLQDVRSPEDHVAEFHQSADSGHVGLVAPDLRRTRAAGRRTSRREADTAGQREAGAGQWETAVVAGIGETDVAVRP